MSDGLVNRRQFGTYCAALGLALPALTHPALAAAQSAAADARRVKFPDGTQVPAIGQGAWHLGQGRHSAADEEAAIRAGLSLGMTLVDTSGNYGNGRSEQFLDHALSGQRDHVYLVSKVEADEIAGDGIARACDASLGRLGTDHLDLYLLHSPVPTSQFAAVVAAFEKLRSVRKIRAWGVSNFDLSQMQELLKVPDGHRCMTNQVAYSLRNRRIEQDLIPWCAQHHMPVMAYSPLGGDNNLVVNDAALLKIAAAHGCSAAAVALAWVIRDGNVIAIPESGSPAHARENAAGLSVMLTPSDLQALASAYPIAGAAG